MADVSRARADLKLWLDDMAALRSVSDPGNPEDQPFADAFAAAREKALAAAKVYEEAVKRG
jgi:hypothetical protein